MDRICDAVVCGVVAVLSVLFKHFKTNAKY